MPWSQCLLHSKHLNRKMFKQHLFKPTNLDCIFKVRRSNHRAEEYAASTGSLQQLWHSVNSVLMPPAIYIQDNSQPSARTAPGYFASPETCFALKAQTPRQVCESCVALLENSNNMKRYYCPQQSYYVNL